MSRTSVDGLCVVPRPTVIETQTGVASTKEALSGDVREAMFEKTVTRAFAGLF